MQTSVNLQETPGLPAARFSLGGLNVPCPLSVRLLEEEFWYGSQRFDALLELTHSEASAVFAVEYKSDWQERSFQRAMEQVRGSLPPGTLPMVALPYLSEERLTVLEENGVSGLDYCGNAIVYAPGKWYVRATGRPNRFRAEPQALRNPYQGKAALVGRVLLTRPVFHRLEDLYAEISGRGGAISLALVSRAVKRLAEDAIVLPYAGNRIWLTQPDKLLDALAREAGKRAPRLVWQGRVDIPDGQILPRLFANAPEGALIVTGLGSATRYANLAMENTVRVYVRDSLSPATLLTDLSVTPTTRFPDLAVYAAPDDAVFFDAEREETDRGVISWASPLQAYFEMSNGDRRLADSALPLRQQILDGVKEKLREP